MGDADAAATAVRGAATPNADHGDAHPQCLNCGTTLIGQHCHNCGQSSHVHRTISAIGHDLAHGVFHFEGKIWRTLPLLALKPGELTRRYIAGERARFVSPLALFLFSVFLMFAVFSLIGGPFANDGATPAGDTRSVVLVPNSAPDGQATMVDLREAKVETGWAWLDHAFAKAKSNPSLLFYKVQANGYKFSWALILLSLPFMWAIFAWKRQYHLFDHLVFVTYSLSFVTLLLVAMAGFRAIGLGRVTEAVLAIGFPVHLYRQLRGAYALSRLSALWRTVFLLAAALVVLLLFALFLLALGAF